MAVAPRWAVKNLANSTEHSKVIAMLYDVLSNWTKLHERNEQLYKLTPFFVFFFFPPVFSQPVSRAFTHHLGDEPRSASRAEISCCCRKMRERGLESSLSPSRTGGAIPPTCFFHHAQHGAFVWCFWWLLDRIRSQDDWRFVQAEELKIRRFRPSPI
jgi:hypothetical protein